MYALEENDTKVGDWFLPNVKPNKWSLPWQEIPSHRCAKSLMHFGASYKPYFNRYRFKAPSAGTGTIRMKVMVKVRLKHKSTCIDRDSTEMPMKDRFSFPVLLSFLLKEKQEINLNGSTLETDNLARNIVILSDLIATKKFWITISIHSKDSPNSLEPCHVPCHYFEPT